MNRPLLFLAFANAEPPLLQALETERKALLQCLQEKDSQDIIKLRHESRIEVPDLSKFLISYHQQLTIFHFAGHANQAMLFFEGGPAHQKGLVGLLGREPNLKLVFLNGCGTEQLALALIEAGVPAVIGTTQPVDDVKAGLFATTFYEALEGGQTIEAAYAHAKSTWEMAYDAPTGNNRAGRRPGLIPNDTCPWVLYLTRQANHPVFSWSLPKWKAKVQVPMIEYGDMALPQDLTPPPFRVPDFLGREKELESLHKKLGANDQLIFLVNGQGGMGKTTLAAEYYHRYQDQYAHRAWVLKERSVGQALLKMAPSLKLFFEDETQEERLELLLNRLSRLKKTNLLVIDNANDIRDLEAHFQLLQRCTNFHVLLTTRITEFPQPVAIQSIEGLPEAQGIDLFQKHYPKLRPEDHAHLKIFLAAIESNTLLIELFAKNLHNLNRLEPQYTLAQFINDINQSLLALSKSSAVQTKYQAHGHSLRKESPEAIVLAMYDVTHLSEAEKRWISVFALLPNERIPYADLKTLFPDTEIQEPVLTLAQKGWIDFSEADTSFKVNQVVQDVVKIKHEQRCWPDIEHAVTSLINLIGHEETLHHEKIMDTYRYLNYAQSIALHLHDQEYLLGILQQNIGNFYTETGDLYQALQAYQAMQAIQDHLQQTDPENPDFKNGLAISYEKLGKTHAALGNLQQALTFFHDETALFEELFEAFPHNVEFKNNLAISYSKLGETHAALGNLQQALTFYESFKSLMKELFEAFPHNVNFKNGLAISYVKLGFAYFENGDLKDGKEHILSAAQLFKELWEAFPAYAEFKRNYENIQEVLKEFPEA